MEFNEQDAIRRMLSTTPKIKFHAIHYENQVILTFYYTNYTKYHLYFRLHLINYTVIYFFATLF
jgi:hypothetical protein